MAHRETRRTDRGPAAMTPAQVTAWRERKGLTLLALGQRLGIAHTTVMRWESGARPIPKWLRYALRGLELNAKRKRRPAE